MACCLATSDAIPPATDAKRFADSSCSHTRITTQPACRSCLVCRRSRFRLSAIFSLHHPLFLFGTEKCCTHPCQKHPSTKTQTWARRNTKSALQRSVLSGRRSIRHFSPRRTRARASARSVVVPRRGVESIFCLTAEELAEGARDLSDGIQPGNSSTTSSGISSTSSNSSEPAPRGITRDSVPTLREIEPPSMLAAKGGNCSGACLVNWSRGSFT